MARSIAFLGLNPWAKEFVREGKMKFVCVEKVVRVYPDGREEVVSSTEITEPEVPFEGGWDNDGHEIWYSPRKFFKTENGVTKCYTEKVQWVRIPEHDICQGVHCLVDENGKDVPESLWTREMVLKEWGLG